MKRSHLTLLAALLIGSAPLVTSAAGWSPNDPLMPTGNSTQDTANLQNAIHDVRLDAGGTLYLGPGVFFVHASLVRQTPDPEGFGYNPVPFNGTIKGAGKSVTTIKSVRGPAGEPFTPFYDKVFDFTYPSTFFIGKEDYLGIRDMTFEADSEIADEWLYGGEVGWTKGLLSYVATGSGEYGVGNQLGTDVINVHFKGSLDSSGRPEMPHLFEPYGGAGGTHNVKSSNFENGLGVMLIYVELANATINVGGRPEEQVTFSNAVNGSISVGLCSDCTVNVSRIETHEAAGVFFRPHWDNTHSTVTMSHSNINLRPQSYYGGAEIWALYGDVDIVLTHNSFHSEDAWLWGPIFSEGVRHGTITNNTFTGHGSAAVYLGVAYQLSGSYAFVGNNMQNWENTGLNPLGIFAAPIWLGSYITDSIVIGGNNSVNVFDEPGYDEFGNPLPPDANGNAQTYDEYGNIIPKNNVFTGVNNMHTNIGQNVREAMGQKVEAKQSMMSELHR